MQSGIRIESRLGRLGRAGLSIGAALLLVACDDRAKSAPAAAPSAAAVVPSASTARPAASTSFYADRFSRRPSVAAMTDLGRRVFFDSTLSASGQMACATCHDPRFAYGPPNDLSTQPGGADTKSPGLRAAPSLRYLQSVPRFDEHHFEESADESVDQGPTGGHGWDGRVDTAHDQARIPLTSPFEMANTSVADVAARVARGPYAADFRGAFGDDVFDAPERGSDAVLMALEVFQQSPKDFYPYTSRYDGYLRRQVELTPAEQRGLIAFEDPRKGNCASCHPSRIRAGAFPQFTDFGFAALGVPRNRTIAANADATFFDLGLCGPLRTDLSAKKSYCGQFRVPSLRNVATRRAFFHNGVFHGLVRVVEFYARRDATRTTWYGAGGAFDDLPAEDRANVNTEAPFGRRPGGAPALTKAEIDDLVVFLKTLTDADVAAN